MIFEAWSNDESVTLISKDHPQKSKLVGDYAELLYIIEAATWEEACAVRNLRQGWSPYQPIGQHDLCPQCSAIYWPEGSAQCWRCGEQKGKQ